MKGSKYGQAVRDEVLALAAAGKTVREICSTTKIPRSTVSAWIARAQDEDEDFQAEQELRRRMRLKRQRSIVDKALLAIERQVKVAAVEGKTIDEGIRVIRNAAKGGKLSLSASEIKTLKKILKEYTGIGLRDLIDTAKKMDEMEAGLQSGTDTSDTASAAARVFVQAALPDRDNVESLFDEDGVGDAREAQTE